MFVATLTPTAIGLLLLLGSMAVSAGITILVVVLLDRHNERVLVEEYTASLEAFLDEMEARLTDPSTPCAPPKIERDADELAWLAERGIYDLDTELGQAKLAANLEHQQLVADTQRIFREVVEPDDDDILIIDDSDEGEDFAEWEVRSVEDADDRARMADLDRDLRICGDMVDELAEYLDVLHYHPLVAGAEDIPVLVTCLDQLIDQEYQLVQATR